MTGATRDEPEFTTSWANSSTQPLDEVYGAGGLNIDRSHAILTAGEFDARDSSLAGSTGWDAGTASATIPALYFFDLPDSELIHDVAGTLVWNREITATNTLPEGPLASYEFDPFLANLDLRLFQVDGGFTLGDELAASLSTVDNVELITFEGPVGGRYVWQITSDTTGTDYGVSWNLEGSQVIPEPSVAALFLLLSPALLRRRC